MTLRLVHDYAKTRLCPSCHGAGFTQLAAFVAALGNLLSMMFGDPVSPWPCKRCRGTGRVPTEET